MSEQLFDALKAKGWEIAEFHAVTNGVAYTEAERQAIDVGLSCGVHAAIEHMAERCRARACQTCNGWNPVTGTKRRETAGLVCQTCGWDYANGEPS